MASPLTTSQPSIAPMLTYVSNFWTGGFDPFWPHVILLSVSVLASIAVGAGILLERPKYSATVHGIAFWLVVAGVAVEASGTIFLFVFDEGISSSQQSKIIALENRLAARTLSGAEVAAIVEKTKPFAGQVFQAIPYWQNTESLFIANEISGTLIKAGWTIDQPKVFTGLFGVITGVLIEYDKGAPEKTVSAAKALAATLNDNGVTASTDENNNPNPTDRISLEVGIKP